MRRRVIAVVSNPPAPQAVARLRLALAGSALLHLAGMSALAPARLPGNPWAPWQPTPITVHIEPLPAPVLPAAATKVVADLPRTRPGRTDATGRLDAARAPSAMERQEALALSVRTDPMVYTPRELDALPQPMLPLDVSRLPDGAAAVRLELTIDEHGAVHDVSFAGPGASRGLERELRALLVATAFLPARKDGRAVKSRITLSVGLATNPPRD